MRKLNEETPWLEPSNGKTKESSTQRLYINFLRFLNNSLPENKIVYVQECYFVKKTKQVVIAFKLEDKSKLSSVYHSTLLSLDYKNQGDIYPEIINIEENPQQLEELKNQYQNEMELFYKDNENLNDTISVITLPQDITAIPSHQEKMPNPEHLHTPKQENSTFFMKTAAALGVGIFTALAYKDLTKSDVLEYISNTFKF